MFVDRFPPSKVAARIAVSLGIRLLVGIEREQSNKDLGIRTFALTALLGTSRFCSVCPWLLCFSRCLFDRHFREHAKLVGRPVLGGDHFSGLALFVLTAAIAMSFRLMCGSLRRPPECSKQRIPAATPHVGQGTARNIPAGSSLILIEASYAGIFCTTVCFGALLIGFQLRGVYISS
jgi:hypothetical protein